MGGGASKDAAEQSSGAPSAEQPAPRTEGRDTGDATQAAADVTQAAADATVVNPNPKSDGSSRPAQATHEVAIAEDDGEEADAFTAALNAQRSNVGPRGSITGNEINAAMALLKGETPALGDVWIACRVALSNGEFCTARYKLNIGVNTIGRERNNTICIKDDQQVSRAHCKLTLAEDGTSVTLANLSSQGTKLNGVKITGDTTPVAATDVVTVGKTEIRLADAASAGDHDAIELKPAVCEPGGEARLVCFVGIKQGGTDIKRYKLLPGENTVGRERGNRITIKSDNQVSRFHCKITMDEQGCCVVEDLNSVVGTQVNGVSAPRMAFGTRDTLTVGGSELRIDEGNGEILSDEASGSRSESLDEHEVIAMGRKDPIPGGMETGKRCLVWQLDGGPNGETQREKFELKIGKNTLGREPSNQIQIRDKRVSRNHCVITMDGQGFCIVEDLGSFGGTVINGVKAKRATYGPGDIMKIGNSKIWPDV